MDTELDYQQQRLKDFREKAKTAQRATELIDLIDRPLLVAADWTVHADNKSSIGAVKVNSSGDEYEIRVGRLNKTIAGTCTLKRRPPKQGAISAFKVAMGEAFQLREMENRKFQPEELNWQEIVKII